MEHPLGFVVQGFEEIYIWFQKFLHAWQKKLGKKMRLLHRG